MFPLPPGPPPGPTFGGIVFDNAPALVDPGGPMSVDPPRPGPPPGPTLGGVTTMAMGEEGNFPPPPGPPSGPTFGGTITDTNVPITDQGAPIADTSNLNFDAFGFRPTFTNPDGSIVFQGKDGISTIAPDLATANQQYFDRISSQLTSDLADLQGTDGVNPYLGQNLDSIKETANLYQSVTGNPFEGLGSAITDFTQGNVEAYNEPAFTVGQPPPTQPIEDPIVVDPDPVVQPDPVDDDTFIQPVNQTFNMDAFNSLLQSLPQANPTPLPAPRPSPFGGNNMSIPLPGFSPPPNPGFPSPGSPFSPFPNTPRRPQPPFMPPIYNQPQPYMPQRPMYQPYNQGFGAGFGMQQPQPFGGGKGGGAGQPQPPFFPQPQPQPSPFGKGGGGGGSGGGGFGFGQPQPRPPNPFLGMQPPMQQPRPPNPFQNFPTPMPQPRPPNPFLGMQPQPMPPDLRPPNPFLGGMGAPQRPPMGGSVMTMALGEDAQGNVPNLPTQRPTLQQQAAMQSGQLGQAPRQQAQPASPFASALGAGMGAFGAGGGGNRTAMF